MRPGDRNALKGGNMGGHRIARVLPGNIRKVDEKWFGGSGGLEGTLALLERSALAQP